MKSVNELKMIFDSKSVNEGFARVAVSSFLACIDPNIEELTDIKTAVSEAVTNSVVHGYCEREGKIYITVSILEKNKVKIRFLWPVTSTAPPPSSSWRSWAHSWAFPSSP